MNMQASVLLVDDERERHRQHASSSLREQFPLGGSAVLLRGSRPPDRRPRVQEGRWRQFQVEDLAEPKGRCERRWASRHASLREPEGLGLGQIADAAHLVDDQVGGGLSGEGQGKSRLALEAEHVRERDAPLRRGATRIGRKLHDLTNHHEGQREGDPAGSEKEDLTPRRGDHGIMVYQ